MILIVDLEATCDDDNSYPLEKMEIIEIGAVITKSDGEIIDQFQLFVKPLLHPNLTVFCKALTGIRQSDVDSALSFKEASIQLQKFVSNYEGIALWGSWGNYDNKQILIECARHNIANPLQHLAHENLKASFAKRRKIRQVGTSKALELTGLIRKGDRHRGLDDAINIAMLLPFCVH